jgi:cytochrome c
MSTCRNAMKTLLASALSALTLSVFVGFGASAAAQSASASQAATKSNVASAANYSGIGRPATAKEVQAWDIDVRPDFKGLPKGSGTVAKGQDVWEGKCASCHGVFGESNEVFSPIVGGTTADDIKTGRVARLKDPNYPQRTTLMKVSTLSTLWDYINRAMPWTQPKSLTVEEVYAVTAYILNLGGVVPDNFTLSDQNIAEVQKRLPNRNGVTTAHAMWPGKEFGGSGKPDVQGSACMRDCAVEAKVESILPDYARNAHGNLQEQNRIVGPQRGADTTKPEAPASGGRSAAPAGAAQAAGGTAAAAAAAPSAAAPQPAAAGKPSAEGAADGKAAQALAQKHACVACHAADRKMVGPSWADIAKKHAGKTDYLAGKIKSGGTGVWGNIPMPPQSLSEAEARIIGAWLAAGAAR